MKSLGPEKYLEYTLVHIAKLRTRCEQLGLGKKPITLELGCGHGHYLTSYAEKHPEQVCLGADLITKRIEKACAKAEKRKLDRLHFMKADANQLLQALPDDLQFSEVFILFPDPWPKKRHHKNRLIQTEFLSNLKKRMAKGGILYFRTDHTEYFEWARECIGQHSQWYIAKDAPWPHEAESYFQNLMDSWHSLVCVSQ